MILQTELVNIECLFDEGLLSLGFTILLGDSDSSSSPESRPLAFALKGTENTVWAFLTPAFSIQMSTELRRMQVLNFSISIQALSTKCSREKTSVYRDKNK